MRPPQTYANLSGQQYLDLVDALQHRWRVATRAVMVLLSANGFDPAEIADLLGYDPVTIRRWIARHGTEGLPGLADRPRPGRPRHGSRHLGERITRLLATPRAWTTTSVWRALGRPAISLRTCYRRLRERARWARPRLIARGDPDHDQICATVRDQVAALPAGSVLLAEDETHLDLLTRVHATWMPHGVRHRIPTPGSNQRRSLFGALDLDTGHWHYQLTIKAVSASFCAFSAHLLAVYPTAPVVMVLCDNDTTHTSKITQRWLAEHPRLHLVTGARYSPQDNPVERIWAALKRAIANTAPTTMTDRVRQAHAYFRHRTPAQLLTSAAPWTSPWLPDDYRQDLRQAA